VSRPPDAFTLNLARVSYFVYRVPDSAAIDLSPDVRPVWAFRPEGQNSGVAHGLPVIPGESFADLKERITRYLEA
jgi:hypothetical protein